MMPPDEPSAFRLDPNDFDSGLLADKVGFLRLAEQGTGDGGLAARVQAAAKQQGYDLVMFRSHEPRPLDGFVHVGTTDEYSGALTSVLVQLNRSQHFDIARVSDRHWPQVEHLLEHAAPTRFGRDPNLTPAIVRRHKLANVKARYNASPECTLIALSAARGALGFQCSYVAGRVVTLYELVTAPVALRGVVAAELLASNLLALRARHPDVDRIVTTVYEDNAASIAFFSDLGLRRAGVRHYHYHLWP